MRELNNTAGARGSRAAALEPAGMRGECPMRLVVNIMPGAMVMNRSRPQSVHLVVYGMVFPVDVKRRLVEAGLSWGPLMPRHGVPLDPPEGQDLDDARLLFRGMPLKCDVSLQEQGVVDGSELRMLRSRSSLQRGADQSGTQQLSARGGNHLSGAPRGLLMNPGLPAWQPGLARR